MAGGGGGTGGADKDGHRRFLNRYYGVSRHFYDLTRKYYLFGRDVEIRELLKEDWTSLVEIGPGTGRNLRKLHEGRPSAKLGGVEASDEMLKHAQGKCPWAKLTQGFAEEADIAGLLGQKPDRILFSYCLSMVVEKDAALDHAQRSLAPGGEVVIVDFGDFQTMPKAFGPVMDKWLDTFHVHPFDTTLVTKRGGTVTWGKGHYFVRARLPAIAD